ncbi:MAG: serine/threonine-protein kinase [Nannocystaceae bacterium]
MQDERDPLLGSVVAGRFKLVRRLASTEMSVVYCAQGQGEEEHDVVALKLLHAATDEKAERCLREARAMSRVRNPHVVQALEYGRIPGQYVFIVMEYLDGESLAETLDREGKLPWRRVVHFARQLAEALAATHAEGIIHRDIKPSNCMRVEQGGDPDFIKLLDFGISKNVDERFATKTSTGSILGTPAYMAPELSATGTPDVASDVYSLGATLYHLVTGRLPFIGETFVDYCYHHQFTPLVSPLERDPQLDLPEAFDALIVRCLAKSPADRYESVTEVVRALDLLLPTDERPSPLRLVAREPSTDEIATTEKPSSATQAMGLGPELGAAELRGIESATRGAMSAANSRIAATRTFRGVPSGPSDILTPSADATPLVTEALRTANDIEAPLPTFAVIMRAAMVACLGAVCLLAWHSLAPLEGSVGGDDGDGLYVNAPAPLRPLPGAAPTGSAPKVDPSSPRAPGRAARRPADRGRSCPFGHPDHAAGSEPSTTSMSTTA